MTSETPAAPAAPAPKPARKRGPKPAADLDAVVRVGAEFRAYITNAKSADGLTLVRLASPAAVRLAEAAAQLNDAQRQMAVAFCETLSKQP